MASGKADDNRGEPLFPVLDPLSEGLGLEDGWNLEDQDDDQQKVKQ